MLASICLLLVVVMTVTEARHVCYQGSSLYQIQTQECEDMDGNYTDTWYCSKVTICEWGISSNRECAETRGCSKEKDCLDSSGDVLNGNTVVLGGTRISTQCCVAHKFDDDDAIAIDLGDICNSGSTLQANILGVVGTFLVAGVVMIWG